MNDKKDLKKSLGEISIKEALSADVEALSFRIHVISDPAPLPQIPITPVVIGLKILNGAKKLIQLGVS